MEPNQILYSDIPWFTWNQMLLRYCTNGHLSQHHNGIMFSGSNPSNWMLELELPKYKSKKLPSAILLCRWKWTFTL